MVRLPHYDLEFNLVCDGKVLPEYAIITDKDRVTCWVPSEEGKISGTSDSPDGPDPAMDVEVYFDGCNEYAVSAIMELQHIKIFYATTEDGIDRRFCFSQVEILEDDDGPDLAESQLKSLGSKNFLLPVALNERSKKHGQHITTLGSEVESSLGAEVEVCKVESLELPPIEVIFRYAPEHILIAHGIIPKAPHPLSPAAAERPLTNTSVKREREDSDNVLTDEEEAAVYARLKVCLAISTYCTISLLHTVRHVL
ncbi:hypothetical protein BS47DRAFT_306573 [Hydnum rufescens UP504]|uniref:Uncharacterized protein n=1 Tax=Hydnum rufescens UP504 TaxID=1448309 RepID=A0A9P6ALI9_9AGAM|nr:hypothetical protein BS47DRAFT_306573 [Hydnum rufescens UP504]